MKDFLTHRLLFDKDDTAAATPAAEPAADPTPGDDAGDVEAINKKFHDFGDLPDFMQGDGPFDEGRATATQERFAEAIDEAKRDDFGSDGGDLAELIGDFGQHEGQGPEDQTDPEQDATGKEGTPTGEASDDKADPEGGEEATSPFLTRFRDRYKDALDGAEIADEDALFSLIDGNLQAVATYAAIEDLAGKHPDLVKVYELMMRPENPVEDFYEAVAQVSQGYVEVTGPDPEVNPQGYAEWFHKKKTAEAEAAQAKEAKAADAKAQADQNTAMETAYADFVKEMEWDEAASDAFIKDVWTPASKDFKLLFKLIQAGHAAPETVEQAKKEGQNAGIRQALQKGKRGAGLPRTPKRSAAAKKDTPAQRDTRRRIRSFHGNGNFTESIVGDWPR